MTDSIIPSGWKNAAQRAAESLFDCVCRVVVKKKIRAEDGSVQFEDEILYNGLPCRIAYKSVGAAKKGSILERPNSMRKNDTLAGEISALVMLFVSPSADIPPGSRVYVIKAGVEMCFVSAGIAAVYTTHKEIVMSAREEYA